MQLVTGKTCVISSVGQTGAARVGAEGRCEAGGGALAVDVVVTGERVRRDDDGDVPRRRLDGDVAVEERVCVAVVNAVWGAHAAERGDVASLLERRWANVAMAMAVAVAATLAVAVAAAMVRVVVQVWVTERMRRVVARVGEH